MLLNHLHSRYLDTNLHTVWVDDVECIATFPIWNISGQLVGYQTYRPDKNKEANNNPKDSRYFTRLKDGKVGVWGLESWKLSNTLFITEGVFDATKLTYFGYSALAVFGNSVCPSTAQWLHMIRQHRPVVSICDSDAAGISLAKYGHTYHVVKDYKDLGDASLLYVKTLLSKFS